uniref:hypothetical protein n=1 Tax=Campylobacter jejuni TaxID=197 RepID=UPI00224279BD
PKKENIKEQEKLNESEKKEPKKEEKLKQEVKKEELKVEKENAKEEEKGFFVVKMAMAKGWDLDNLNIKGSDKFKAEYYKQIAEIQKNKIKEL